MKITNLVAGAATAAVLAGAPTALANVPYADLGSPEGALTTVAVGNELSCQIQHLGDDGGAFYSTSEAPADCGTFLASEGTLYAPDFASHERSAARSNLGNYTPFTPVSQSPVTGTGTAADPFRVVTKVTAGASGLGITETDSYVKGEEAVRTDITVSNDDGAAHDVVLYRAADCYVGSDEGYGVFDPQTNAIACAANKHNEPAGRIEQFFPITGGNHWAEGGYSEVWAQIAAKGDFNDDCSLCDADGLDNGAGISWSFSVPAHGSVTRSLYTSSSPTGQVGPPPSGQQQEPEEQHTTPPQQSNGDVTLNVDPPKTCNAGKARARVTSARKRKLAKDRFGFVRRVKILRVDFYLDGQRKLVDRRAAFKAILDTDGKAHELKARVTLQPLRTRGKQVLVGKRFTRTVKTSIKPCA